MQHFTHKCITDYKSLKYNKLKQKTDSIVTVVTKKNKKYRKSEKMQP